MLALDETTAPPLLGADPEGMSEGVFTTDVEGRITYWNAAAERITGWTRAEALGRSCSVLAGNSVTGCPCGAGPVRCGRISPGQASSTSCSIKTKAGRALLVVKNAVALRGGGGEVVGSLETFAPVRPLDQAPRAEPSPPTAASAGFCGMVGHTPGMRELFKTVALVAESGATVMITGDTGVGKECIAFAIHQLSPRARGPFIRVNCAALNENLLESELFGHVRGAFTGALRDRRGRFEEAGGGTLFLDEIGDIAPGVQVKLLRVLEQKEIERVGQSRPIPVDARLVFATNRDLRALVARGEFRADLFFRINVFPIHVPPLLERLEDVPALAEAIVQRHRRGASVRLSPGAVEQLMRHRWPGNVRELSNVLEYAMVRAGFGEILPAHLPAELLRQLDLVPAAPAVAITDEALRAALDAHAWSRTETAHRLGISRVTLWKRMKRAGLLRGR